MPFKPLKATLAEYPLGTIVFYCDIGTYNSRPKGITHVGIVVDNVNGSPVIAHAADGNKVSHVVESFLAENNGGLEYIKVKLPDCFDVKLIIALAKSLSIPKEADSSEKIIGYSYDRRNEMEKQLTVMYDYNSSINKKNILEKTIKQNIDFCIDSFVTNDTNKKHSAWFTVLAKALNVIRSNLVGDIRSYMGSDFKGNLIKDFHADFRDKFSKYSFTSKGYHCVQFVVVILQISFLLSDKIIRGFISEANLKEERIYYSRKKVDFIRDGIFKSNHPSTIINNGCIGAFKSHFIAGSLPADGKFLSPAGLLYMFFSGWKGPMGTSGPFGVHLVSSTFGAVHLPSLSEAISIINNKVLRVLQNKVHISLNTIKKVNIMLELFSIKKAVEAIIRRDIRLSIQRVVEPDLARLLNSYARSNIYRRVRNEESSEDIRPSKRFKK
jgi:hypothetical protein